VNEQTRNEIIHRSLRGQSQREIAKRLHVSRNTIKSVLDDLQSAREGKAIRLDRPSSNKKRARRLDPYETTLKELLVHYPDMPVVQVQQKNPSGKSISFARSRERCVAVLAGGGKAQSTRDWPSSRRLTTGGRTSDPVAAQPLARLAVTRGGSVGDR
jgi:DNA-binding transcriptional MocR family regulator